MAASARFAVVKVEVLYDAKQLIRVLIIRPYKAQLVSLGPSETSPPRRDYLKLRPENKTNKKGDAGSAMVLQRDLWCSESPLGGLGAVRRHVLGLLRFGPL